MTTGPGRSDPRLAKFEAPADSWLQRKKKRQPIVYSTSSDDDSSDDDEPPAVAVAARAVAEAEEFSVGEEAPKKTNSKKSKTESDSDSESDSIKPKPKSLIAAAPSKSKRKSKHKFRPSFASSSSEEEDSDDDEEEEAPPPPPKRQPKERRRQKEGRPVNPLQLEQLERQKVQVYQEKSSPNGNKNNTKIPDIQSKEDALWESDQDEVLLTSTGQKIPPKKQTKKKKTDASPSPPTKKKPAPKRMAQIAARVSTGTSPVGNRRSKKKSSATKSNNNGNDEESTNSQSHSPRSNKPKMNTINRVSLSSSSTRKSTTNNKRSRQEDDESESDNMDSEDDMPRPSTKKRSKTTNIAPLTIVEALPTLTLAEERQVLANIESTPDKYLQLVLWSVGCHFCLHPHQFKGVRAIAGLPPDFPDVANGELLDPNEMDYRYEARKLLQTAPTLCSTITGEGSSRGLLMADVMGLGKTVQAVVGCVLRNAFHEANETPEKPTLICSPNEAVLQQWHNHLILAGVDPRKIIRFKPKTDQPSFARSRGGNDIFVLCHRYDLQTEVRHVFDSLAKPVRYRKTSPLFPHASELLLTILSNQYRAAKGKEKNEYKDDARMTISTNISEKLVDAARKVIKKETTFRTVVIDEAHFLKNLKTFWGMAAGMLGLHCERMVPMTGTPYQNNLQDMASLMTFIDPSDDSAYEDWWKAATEEGAAQKVLERIDHWSSTYLLRRGKDAIADRLPKKYVHKEKILVYPRELEVYDVYENKFLKALQELKACGDAKSLSALRKTNRIAQKMLALAACMRAALIHPVLPGGGRDLTVFFSPTRRTMRSVIKSQEKPNQCVKCYRTVKLKAKKKDAGTGTADAYENLEDENVNQEDDDLFVEVEEGEEDVTKSDDDDDDDDDDESSATESKKKRESRQSQPDEKGKKGTGDIIPIPADMCRLRDEGIRHFACESCLEELIEEERPCCRCSSLFGRLRRGYEDKKREVNEKAQARMEQVMSEGDSETKQLEADVTMSTSAMKTEPDIVPSLGDNGSNQLGVKEEGGTAMPACKLEPDQVLSTGDSTSDQQEIKAEPNQMSQSLRDRAAEGSESIEEEAPKEDIDPEPIGRLYCRDIFGGFEGSGKLESIVSDFETKVPPDDKVLIASFFKSSLDLLEAMLFELHPEVGVARFDGDIKQIDREAVLHEFKTKKSCRILLMTVQTGGTGLNLVAANHVWFIDRFWNPMVMEQCEDRCYRLGQTKNVEVVYRDVSLTVDDAMEHINKTKWTNAAVLLADGPALADGGMSFKAISGFLGKAIFALRRCRINHMHGQTDGIVTRYPPFENGLLEDGNTVETAGSSKGVLADEATSSFPGTPRPTLAPEIADRVVSGSQANAVPEAASSALVQDPSTSTSTIADVAATANWQGVSPMHVSSSDHASNPLPASVEPDRPLSLESTSSQARRALQSPAEPYKLTNHHGPVPMEIASSATASGPCEIISKNDANAVPDVAGSSGHPVAERHGSQGVIELLDDSDDEEASSGAGDGILLPGGSQADPVILD